MSVMLPHRRSHSFLLCLFLIDLPVLATVAVVGWFYGYRHTYWAVSDWRMSHPWSLIPSLLLLLWIVRKWWRS